MVRIMRLNRINSLDMSLPILTTKHYFFRNHGVPYFLSLRMLNNLQEINLSNTGVCNIVLEKKSEELSWFSKVDMEQHPPSIQC